MQRWKIFYIWFFIANKWLSRWTTIKSHLQVAIVLKSILYLGFLHLLIYRVSENKVYELFRHLIVSETKQKTASVCAVMHLCQTNLSWQEEARKKNQT